MIISRSIHVVPSGIISFFFVAEQYSTVSIYITSPLSIQSVDGYLGCFCALAIVNGAAMDLCICMWLKVTSPARLP